MRVQPSGGSEYLLLLTDHLTRYTQAYPTKNKATKTAAKLCNDFILRLDIPSEILHDHGGEFENDLFIIFIVVVIIIIVIIVIYHYY